MESITTYERAAPVPPVPERKDNSVVWKESYNTSSFIVKGYKRNWVELRVLLTFLTIALSCYRSLPKTWKAIKRTISFMKNVTGTGKKRRFLEVDGRYYFGLYTPAFPSPRYNEFIRTDLNKMIPHDQPVKRLQSIFLAMTNKCPLHCEHCYEWNNLNQEEIFTTDELKKIIAAIQKGGCTQIYFTGGEPLVRMKKLEELVTCASELSDCWISTSGTNLTLQNAVRLKNAGATGVLISLDHYEKEAHNVFRGSDHAYEGVMQAVYNAHYVKLVTAFSICMTRSFVTEEHLMKYAALAKECGVAFVQLLEPKAVGHYEGKVVSLTKEHFDLLDKFYVNINFNPSFRDYPVYIYHGYHQRKLGCLAAGKWSMHIDAAGFINACPFCHTRSYDAHDLITGKLKMDELVMGNCPSNRNMESVSFSRRAILEKS